MEQALETREWADRGDIWTQQGEWRGWDAELREGNLDRISVGCKEVYGTLGFKMLINQHQEQHPASKCRMSKIETENLTIILGKNTFLNAPCLLHGAEYI